MALRVSGTDADFKFKVGEEVTYSENGHDYTVLYRHVVFGSQKIYLLRACDPNIPTQKLQLDVSDESKLTLTDCLSVLTKLWPNLNREAGTSGQSFMNYILNNVLGRICDLTEGHSHAVKFNYPGNSFKMTFEGVEFVKDL